jgi:catechol 2,3-dioxygenase-like lactoylglutathione lyase family enzyme
MPEYRYDHVHLRSADPNATAHFFEAMFGAEVKRDIYPPGTLYPGQMRVRMKVGGQTVLIGPAPGVPHYGLEHFGLTVDNLDTAVTELRAKGAEIAVGPVMRSPGLYLAFVRGPEGVMVELVQR